MDFARLMGDFAPMLNVFKSGGNPMSMIQNMMGPQRYQEFQSFMRQAQQSQQNPEDFVKQQFQQSGIDLGELRKTLGI